MCLKTKMQCNHFELCMSCLSYVKLASIDRGQGENVFCLPETAVETLAVTFSRYSCEYMYFVVYNFQRKNRQQHKLAKYSLSQKNILTK